MLIENNFVEIISKANSIKNKRTENSINIKFFTNTIINPIDKILKYQIKKKKFRHIY